MIYITRNMYLCHSTAAANIIQCHEPRCISLCLQPGAKYCKARAVPFCACEAIHMDWKRHERCHHAIWHDNKSSHDPVTVFATEHRVAHLRHHARSCKCRIHANLYACPNNMSNLSQTHCSS